MKTIIEFVKENHLKIGDKITNESQTWILTQDHISTVASYFLKNLNGKGHIAADIVDQICIPNLSIIPNEIEVARYTVKLKSDSILDNPSQYFKNLLDVAQFYKDKGLTVESFQKLQFTAKKVQEVPDKISYS